MSKLLILTGVQGSGKTSWAREFLKDKKDWIRVSRDDIRVARGDYWIPEQENYITKVEEFQVNSALESGYNVIVDAMNLNPKTIVKWKEFAESKKCEIEFKSFFVEYKEGWKRLQARNTTSPIQITKEVYTSTFKKYYPEKFIGGDYRPILKPTNLPKCVIIDLDGTLALNTNGRSPYNYSRVGDDYCDPRLKQLIQVIYQGYYSNLKGTFKSSPEIIFLSGREGTKTCLDNTKEWLNRNIGLELDFNYKLYTRSEKDFRKDAVVKQELYERYIKDVYDVLAVFDDRDVVVKMWRELGLLCCQVYYGDF